MISESSYWKDTLRKHAQALNAKLDQRTWRDSSYGRLEETVMLSCYVVRKLAEAKKITEATYNSPISIRRFPATGESIDLFNRHKIDELYHLSEGANVTKPLSYVINQLIHSFVFVPVFEAPGKIYGFTFNSDRTRVKELYMVSLRTLAEVFAKISNLYISQRSYIRIEPSGEWEVTSEQEALSQVAPYKGLI